MANASGKGEWLKRVGLGCVAVLGGTLVLVAVGVAVQVGRLRASGPPAISTLEAPHEAQVAATMPLRVELDLSDGKFRVEPAATGGLRVEGHFDLARHELTQSLDTEASGQRVWRVRYRSRGFMTHVATHVSGRAPGTVTVFIPKSLPISLSARLEKGGGSVELGGLALSRADLHVNTGEWTVGFAEPTATPLEHLAVDGSFGETRVVHLGNASPRAASFHQWLGPMRLDLSGPWQGTADVDVRFRFGEMRVVARPDVPLAIGDITVKAAGEDLGSLAPLPQEAPGGPVVHLTGGGAFGHLVVER